MRDVLIVGAGPAGAIAGLVAVRAGARVRIVDRARFPRDKLCGDTVNPGAMAQLHRHGVGAEVEARGLRVAGMIVTSESGVQIEGRYPRELHGRAIVRRDLDEILLRAAIAAGCEFEPAVNVRRAIVGERRGAAHVTGVAIATPSGARELRAPVVIAADGRRSTVAFGLGLARHPARPRRWAIGAYFTGVRPQFDVERHMLGSDPKPTTSGSDTCPTGVRPQFGDDQSMLGSDPFEDSDIVGEMHLRRNCYIGVAPVPGELTNVCLVKPSTGPEPAFRDPAAILRHQLATDPVLRDRFVAATLVAPPVVLGPLAVDGTGGHVDGLLLAGDAAGFIDPMTGDGLTFALRGGELAANAALAALDRGWTGIHARLAAARAEAFAGKWHFNRALRSFVASPTAVAAAAVAARLAPSAIRAIVARAGDCHVAAHHS